MGFLGVCFVVVLVVVAVVVVVVGVKLFLCLKPVWIMLETWNQVCKYRNIFRFREYTS